MKKNVLSIAMLSLAVGPIYAATQNTIVATNCIVKKMTASYTQLASDTSNVLISTDDAGVQNLMYAKNRGDNINEVCGQFVDVTEEWTNYKAKHNLDNDAAKTFLNEYDKPIKKLARLEVPNIIKNRALIIDVLRTINSQYMWRDLNHLVQYQSRYAKEQDGIDATTWIKEQVESMITENNRSSDVTVFTVKTRNTIPQPSIVVKIGTSTEPGVILSAHIDTVAPLGSIKPGADDDGTGTVIVLEAARRLMASKTHFRKPIYLIWFAAAENGLVGSSSVVNYFKTHNILVDTMMQMDMSAYTNLNVRKIWLMSNNTDPILNNSVVEIIGAFVHRPIGFTNCGFAFSDNYTWEKAGVATTLPFETEYSKRNPNMETPHDEISILSQQKMTDFAKLAIAYAMEYAQPVAR